MMPPKRSPNDDADFDASAVLESLQSAYSPESLDDEVNAKLIDAAFPSHVPGELTANDAMAARESDEIVCNSMERADAERLARAWDPREGHPLVQIAELLRNAHSPMPIAQATTVQLASDAIHRKHTIGSARFRRLSYVSATLAIAASVAFWIQRSPRSAFEDSTSPAEQLAQSRSVAPMFVETYDQATPTQRIDRIYALRSRELRHNRYVSWRVR